jgi:hypothetical protein
MVFNGPDNYETDAGTEYTNFSGKRMERSRATTPQRVARWKWLE